MQAHQLRNIDDFSQTEMMKSAKKSMEDKYLNIRFCHGDEVSNKRQKFIVFKQVYYQKHDHMKKNGQKFHTVQLIEKFINENIDELFKNRKKDSDESRYNSNARSMAMS